MAALWDRLLLAGAGCLGKGQSLAGGLFGAAPANDVSYSLALLAAALILRESPSLKVVCASSGGGSGGSSAPGGGGGASGPRYLIGITLDGAAKRAMLNTAPPGGLAAWLESAFALVSTTPQSWLDRLCTPAATLGGGGGDAAVFSPACPGVLYVSSTEVARQLVFGYHRVAVAMQAPGGGGAPPTPPLLPSSITTPTSPCKFLLVDVRPIVHRRGGGIVGAYNVDPRTIKPLGGGDAGAAVATPEEEA